MTANALLRNKDGASPSNQITEEIVLELPKIGDTPEIQPHYKETDLQTINSIKHKNIQNLSPLQKFKSGMTNHYNVYKTL